VEKRSHSSWRSFLRLWFVLGFAYFMIKFVFNLGIMGWIDVRPVAFLELALVPLGQSVVFWTITRRARKGAAGTPPEQDQQPVGLAARNDPTLS
jgi:hypothetical protein